MIPNVFFVHLIILSSVRNAKKKHENSSGLGSSMRRAEACGILEVGEGWGGGLGSSSIAHMQRRAWLCCRLGMRRVLWAPLGGFVQCTVVLHVCVCM